MEVIPSIDLKAGRCVRLYQGDYQQETVYSEDPVSVALDWQRQGAVRLHLVDLDGAAQGRLANLEAIKGIINQLDIAVQVGGGVRNLETAQMLFEAEADRVVVGTAALRDPSLVRDLCYRFGSDRVLVAVDAKDGRVAIEGWTEQSSVTALELAQGMAELGVRRILYTDVLRDGTLTGPNVSANADLVRQTGMAVLASGGIGSLEHIKRIAKTGVEGVVLGRALYTGAVSLADAFVTANTG